MNHFGTRLELKTVDTMQRIIAGYAAAHSNLDRVRDIIDPQASVKMTNRLRTPSDVEVFIGHDSSQLPVGIPLKIEPTAQGLYTETRILNGPVGDNLLAVAKDLQDHGLALGMSIGYQTRDSKPDRVAGKMVRRILDYDLKEYSFASAKAIANPAALVTSVKARRKALSEGSDTAGGMLVPADRKGATSMQYRVEQANGKWLVLCDADDDGDADDNQVIGSYDDEATANAVVLALRKAADTYGDSDDDATMGGDGKTMDGRKAMWTTAQVNDLPDSSFLYIAPGGDKDEEGKTTPRALRMFPYKDAGGKIDLPHLRNAIARIPQSDAKGLDKDKLQARARALLEKETGGGKTVDAEAEEWKTGAPITVLGLAYRLIDLAEQIAAEQKAMQLLGENTKEFYRIRQPVRDALTAVQTDLGKLVGWSTTIDKGEDEAAKVAWYRAQLALASS